MINEVLQKLGLNETEIKVYLAMLSSGTTPASVLARRTGLPRSTARYNCQQLVQAGLVITGTKNNATLYTAKNPDSLFALLEKDREALKKKSAQVSNIIGALKNMYNPKTSLPKVTFYEGVDGVISMLDDVINDNEPLYAAVRLTDNIHSEITRYLREVYVPKRKKMLNKTRALFSNNKETVSYKKDSDRENKISLFVPEDKFPFDQCLHIYGDKVAFYYANSYDVGGVIMKDMHMRKTQLSLFEMAWNFARALPENKKYKNQELD